MQTLILNASLLYYQAGGLLKGIPICGVSYQFKVPSPLLQLLPLLFFSVLSASLSPINLFGFPSLDPLLSPSLSVLVTSRLPW